MGSLFRVLAIVMAVGVFSLSPALAQQAGQTAGQGSGQTAGQAPAQATDAGGSKQQLLTPEQVEEMEAMVKRLRGAMADLVQTARKSASKMAQDSGVIMLTTNQVAAIGIGAAAGAIVIDFLGGGGLATMTGAVIGGIAGHWMTSAQPANHHAMPEEKKT